MCSWANTSLFLVDTCYCVRNKDIRCMNNIRTYTNLASNPRSTLLKLRIGSRVRNDSYKNTKYHLFEFPLRVRYQIKCSIYSGKYTKWVHFNISVWAWSCYKIQTWVRENLAFQLSMQWWSRCSLLLLISAMIYSSNSCSICNLCKNVRANIYQRVAHQFKFDTCLTVTFVIQDTLKWNIIHAIIPA